MVIAFHALCQKRTMNFMFAWQNQYLTYIVLPPEHKIHIFEPTCDILYILSTRKLYDTQPWYKTLKRTEDENLSNCTPFRNVVAAYITRHASRGVEVWYHFYWTIWGCVFLSGWEEVSLLFSRLFDYLLRQFCYNILVINFFYHLKNILSCLCVSATSAKFSTLLNVNTKLVVLCEINIWRQHSLAESASQKFSFSKIPLLQNAGDLRILLKIPFLENGFVPYKLNALLTCCRTIFFSSPAQSESQNRYQTLSLILFRPG